MSVRCCLSLPTSCSSPFPESKFDIPETKRSQGVFIDHGMSDHGMSSKSIRVIASEFRVRRMVVMVVCPGGEAKEDCGG